MDNILNFWLNGGILRGIEDRKQNEKNNKILRNEVGEYIIDSLNTFDEGYETAIKKSDGDWIIVQRYCNEEKMKEGHNKWCEFCKDNPKGAYSVQLDEYEEF